jgi:Flp pilus assembly protein TadG
MGVQLGEVKRVMPETKRSTWCRFRRDERGNIAILFAAVSVPLLILLGGATDLARYTRYKAELSNAVDSAALALARKGEDFTDQQAQTFVENYVAAFQLEDSKFSIGDFSVTRTTNGYRVGVDASMGTIFLPLTAFTGGGDSIDSMSMDIAAEVVTSSNQVELALVLDNTGSMNCGATVSSACTGNWQNPGSSSRISGLKNAANKLVDVLMTPAALQNGYVKIGVVPFEGAVNIKNSALNYSWLDWSDVAAAKYNGRNFNEYDVDTSNDSCTETATPGHWEWHSYHWVWVEGGTTTSCSETTERVSHKWLFDQLHAKDSSVEWAGCVEMRAAPYDILDTAPTSSNVDTLFVPFFWPDEPDSDNDNGDYYTNDYLDDDTSSNGSAAQKNTEKYLTSNVSWHSGKKDTTFPYTSGPNYGCPRPILPLTNNKASVTSSINNMIAYPAMGTYIPTGLVWGWHVLSHGAPFTEGLGPNDDNYDKTVKAIVLLSDGENSVTGMSNHDKSIFSGYNYTGLSVDGSYRLGSSNASTAQSNLNSKTATLCQNVKDAGIRLYTITFGDIPSAAETLMRNCATVDDGETLYYHAPSNAELETIFYSIGEDLSEIHLSM